jgi:lactate dehydrogenase-like 2-hydroxyacid dehydrogenase/nicotinamidase-related amidase
MNTTLILLDIQNAFCSPNGSYARRGYAISNLADTIRACSTLLQLFRSHRMPIVHIVTELSHGYGDAGSLIYEKYPEVIQYNGYLPDNGESTPPPELIPLPGEPVVRKKRYDPFFNTDLDNLLRGLNTRTLVVAGILTNVCVYACGLSAIDRDYEVLLVRECTTAWTESIKNEFSLSFENHIGQVVSLESVDALLHMRLPTSCGPDVVRVCSTGLPGEMDDILQHHLDRVLVAQSSYRVVSESDYDDWNADVIVLGSDQDSEAHVSLNRIHRQISSDGSMRLRGIISLRPSRDAGLNLADLKKRGVQYVPMTAVYQQTTADHAAMLLLAAHRHLLTYANYSLHRRCCSGTVRSDPCGLETVNWADAEAAMDFDGVRIVLLGFGGIALEIVSRHQFRGAKVYYHKRTRLHRTMETLLALEYVSWPDALSCADYLIVTLPLNATTAQLLGSRELQLLPKHATIVQVGRAQVIEQESLYDALVQGRLRQYIADVHYEEPVDANDRFLALPNVLLTPHYGGGKVYRMKTAQQIAENIKAIVTNERAPHQYALPGWRIPWEQFLTVGR